MRGKFFKKEPSNKVILFCNPNGLSYEYLIFGNCIIDIFLENNIDVCVWNYKGYGKRNGIPNFFNMSNEAEKIIDHLDKSLNYTNIGLYGYSLGGSVACKVANKSKKINIIICDRTFSSLERIVKSRLNYSFIKIILNIFFINDNQNHQDFYDLNNESIHKVIICDYNDEVISMDSSLKRGVEYKIKKEIISKEIKRIFSVKKDNDDKIIGASHNKNEYDDNFTDLIRNKNLFSNVEIENLKLDFIKTLQFLNEKEDSFFKNLKDNNADKENNKGCEKKFESQLDKKCESKVINEKTLKLKNMLRDFFCFFAKESKYFDLINNFSDNINHRNLESFINFMVTELFIWGQYHYKENHLTYKKYEDSFQNMKNVEYLTSFWIFLGKYNKISELVQDLCPQQFKFLKGLEKTLKKITIFLINFIYKIEIPLDIDRNELRNTMESLTFPDMIENINPLFLEMVRKRGDLIIVNCGHNGFLNRSEKENFRNFLFKYLSK